MKSKRSAMSGLGRILGRACVGVFAGAATLVLANAPTYADPGGGDALQSGTVFCAPLGTVTVTSPPAHAITPMAFIEGGVWLTQSETITGPRCTLTQVYGIPTDGRPTANCTISFRLVTITSTAVQVS